MHKGAAHRPPLYVNQTITQTGTDIASYIAIPIVGVKTKNLTKGGKLFFIFIYSLANACFSFRRKFER